MQQTERASGAVLPPLGVGTWQWGDRWVWEFGKAYSDADVRGAFDAAVAAGVTLFDTAEIYGLGVSERLLGRFIRDSGMEVQVATKYFPFPWRLGRRSMVRALRRSLDRLGLEQVALYQVHWPSPLLSPDRIAAGLAECVRQGLTRAVGVSNFDARWTRRTHAALARHGIALASNQVEYSLLQRAPEGNGVLQTCQELGVTVIAYSPLAMGLLTGKYSPDHPPPGWRGQRAHQKARTLRVLLPALGRIAEACEKSLAQVALNWLICRGTVPIPGAWNARQAESNAGALGWSLTPEEMEILDRASC